MWSKSTSAKSENVIISLTDRAVSPHWCYVYGQNISEMRTRCLFGWLLASKSNEMLDSPHEAAVSPVFGLRCLDFGRLSMDPALSPTLPGSCLNHFHSLRSCHRLQTAETDERRRGQTEKHRWNTQWGTQSGFTGKHTGNSSTPKISSTLRNEHMMSCATAWCG